MEQTTLAIAIEQGTAPPIALRLEQRKRLVEIMAVAILAVHRASERTASEEDDDDDACE